LVLLPKRQRRCNLKIYTLSGFETIQEVDVKNLRQLIADIEISDFKRAEGWVTIGIHPIRGDGGDYDGPERREVIQKPIPEVTGIHYCFLPNK
jgi:hypothetical protein